MSNKQEKRETPKQAGTGIHLMQTIVKRVKSGGVVSKAFYQGRCNMCKGTKKSKYICSDRFQRKKKDVYLCHTGTKRSCFYTPLGQQHYIDVE